MPSIGSLEQIIPSHITHLHQEGARNARDLASTPNTPMSMVQFMPFEHPIIALCAQASCQIAPLPSGASPTLPTSRLRLP